MTDIFERMLLAHLCGDYLLQSKKMALQKSSSILWCTAHVLIYSLMFCLFLWTVNPWIFLAIFIPHWIIDYWSLGLYWLKLIGGRTFDALSDKSITLASLCDVSFTCFVYAVVDNTWHLLCLWAVSKLFF